MEIKAVYERGKEFGIRAGIEIPKYLFGYDIHASNVKRRQEIRDSDDDLRRKVLNLSLNYAWEGFREAIRYAPLVLEGLILYEHATNDLPLSTWVYTSMPVRALEGLVMEDNKRSKRVFEKLDQSFQNLERLLEEFNKSIQDLEGSLEKFEEIIKVLAGILDNNPEFRALWQGRLLADPYSVLGVTQSASEYQIKKAYRSIALECHPDKNSGSDESKTRRFIEATKAYYQLTGQYEKI